MIDSYIVAIILIVVGLIILGSFYVKSRKNNSDSTSEINRYKACKMAFFHILTMYILYFLYDLLAKETCLRLSGMLVVFLSLTVGIIVYMGYCIIHDDEKTAAKYSGIKTILITNFICVVCWIITFSLYSFDELFKIKDGVIDVATADCMWLFIVPIYVVNTAILLIKHRCCKTKNKRD